MIILYYYYFYLKKKKYKHYMMNTVKTIGINIIFNITLTQKKLNFVLFNLKY